MANLRVDRKDDSDIGPPLGYFQTMGIIAAVVVVVVLVINGLCTWSTWYDNNHAVPAANAKIEEFNNLPLESRKVIIEWNQIEDFEPETYLRPFQEEQRLSFWLADYPDAFAFWAIILTSVITFLLYSVCCSEKYYLCDIPQTWYGRMLFVIMFVCWPFLLISWVRMHIKEGDNLRARREHERAEAKWSTDSTEPGATSAAETTTGLAGQEDTEPMSAQESDSDAWAAGETKIRPTLRLQTDAEAEAEYLKFASVSAPARIESELETVNEDIARAGKEIAMSAARVRSEQIRLGTLNAKKQNLLDAQAQYDAEATQAKAQTEWQMIRQMQGVYKVMFEPADAGAEVKDGLVVWVRVCVPYDGKYYDFGDFRIALDAVYGYECKEIRDSRLPDYQNSEPRYRCGDAGKDFCFGDRGGEIEIHVEHGRYPEALALMIDCLHWVNEEDCSDIPQCFREIDPQSDPIISQYYVKEDN